MCSRLSTKAEYDALWCSVVCVIQSSGENVDHKLNCFAIYRMSLGRDKGDMEEGGSEMLVARQAPSHDRIL